MIEQILNPKFVNNKYTIQLYEPQNKLGLVTRVFNSALGEAEAGSSVSSRTVYTENSRSSRTT